MIVVIYKIILSGKSLTIYILEARSADLSPYLQELATGPYPEPT
jgi:hypothetical protein